MIFSISLKPPTIFKKDYTQFYPKYLSKVGGKIKKVTVPAVTF